MKVVPSISVPFATSLPLFVSLPHVVSELPPETKSRPVLKLRRPKIGNETSIDKLTGLLLFLKFLFLFFGLFGKVLEGDALDLLIRLVHRCSPSRGVWLTSYWIENWIEKQKVGCVCCVSLCLLKWNLILTGLFPALYLISVKYQGLHFLEYVATSISKSVVLPDSWTVGLFFISRLQLSKPQFRSIQANMNNYMEWVSEWEWILGIPSILRMFKIV